LTPLLPPSKEIDIAFLVFVERYAPNLLKWDIMAFFARNPNLAVTAVEISRQIGRPVQGVRPGLGDLVILGLLEPQCSANGQTRYLLTHDPPLRRLALKLADQTLLAPGGSPADN
jgi:hypothetical protein